MTLGALLDLGVDREAFTEELEKLHLSGYRLEFETVERNAVRANHVNVVLTGEEEHPHEHEHTQEEQAYGHEGHWEHGHKHGAHDGHGHIQEQEAQQEHAHKQEEHQEHSHPHVHRSFGDIREMIEKSELSKPVKELALKIFLRVARAEARVHGKTVDEVHFHEVGAVDSIVDIVGCAILIHMLKPDAVYASIVQDGHGFVRCQHGLLSVPVPAVSEIFAASDVRVRQIDVETELVTPTGAAIIAELASFFGPMPAMKIERIGWGAGTKILPIPNVLKVYRGYRQTEGTDACNRDEIQVLETNLDDCTGEMLGYALEKLMEEGALDVFYTPIFMKKNRPAYRLTVLAKPEDTLKMEKLIFTHTTTIGIRKRMETRSILKREKTSVTTPYGELEVKKVTLPDGERSYPEYESAVKLAEEHQVSLRDIYGSL